MCKPCDVENVQRRPRDILTVACLLLGNELLVVDIYCCETSVKMIFQRLLVFMLVLHVSNVQVSADATGCPNSTATDGTKPLYLVVLVAMYPQIEIPLLAAKIVQEEINYRSDILPGYRIELITDTIEICSSSEAGIGLSKLVKYTVSPPCRPVVAVMGLECSSHTSVISPVAGHKGFDLILMSRAFSPIFETKNQHFPHYFVAHCRSCQ